MYIPNVAWTFDLHPFLNQYTMFCESDLQLCMALSTFIECVICELAYDNYID